MASKKHRPDRTEEWLVFGFLLMVDIIMPLLDLIGIGEAINWLIESFIAMAYPFYLWIRGYDVKDNKRVGGIITTWLIGLLSFGVLDLWSIDQLYNMHLTRQEEAKEKAAENAKRLTRPKIVRRFPTPQLQSSSEQEIYEENLEEAA